MKQLRNISVANVQTEEDYLKIVNRCELTPNNTNINNFKTTSSNVIFDNNDSNSFMHSWNYSYLNTCTERYNSPQEFYNVYCEPKLNFKL